MVERLSQFKPQSVLFRPEYASVVKPITCQLLMCKIGLVFFLPLYGVRCVVPQVRSKLSSWFPSPLVSTARHDRRTYFSVRPRTLLPAPSMCDVSYFLSPWIGRRSDGAEAMAEVVGPFRRRKQTSAGDLLLDSMETLGFIAPASFVKGGGPTYCDTQGPTSSIDHFLVVRSNECLWCRSLFSSVGAARQHTREAYVMGH